MSLPKRTIVIVGATSGVGEALVNRFISLNWNVIGLGRNKTKLIDQEGLHGNNFRGFVVDITNENEVKKVFKDISSVVEKIDLLVNNAAVFKMDYFTNCSFEDINHLVDTNLKGIMFITLEALKLMKDINKPSRIVNIASVASLHGISKQSIYCATKFGLNGFSEALNQEIISEYNISITTLFPGGINTPLWNENNPYPGEKKSNILQPEDIVGAVEYIAELEPRIILKNMTIFPSNEWH